MKEDLLDLVPKRYLCPFCGEWHYMRRALELSSFDSEEEEETLYCESERYYRNNNEMKIYFADGKCHYRTLHDCKNYDLKLQGSIPISDILESSDKPQVTFSVPFTAKKFCSACQMCKLSEIGDGCQMDIKFGFEFGQSEYNKFKTTT